MKSEINIQSEITRLYAKYGWSEMFLYKCQLIYDSQKEKYENILTAIKSSTLEEAYVAGQDSMYCGCYEVENCTSYKDWISKKAKECHD